MKDKASNKSTYSGSGGVGSSSKLSISSTPPSHSSLIYGPQSTSLASAGDTSSHKDHSQLLSQTGVFASMLPGLSLSSQQPAAGPVDLRLSTPYKPIAPAPTPTMSSSSTSMAPAVSAAPSLPHFSNGPPMSSIVAPSLQTANSGEIKDEPLDRDEEDCYEDEQPLVISEELSDVASNESGTEGEGETMSVNSMGSLAGDCSLGVPVHSDHTVPVHSDHTAITREVGVCVTIYKRSVCL